MVTLCATPSLGMLIIPGTWNVALIFPLDDTESWRCPRAIIALPASVIAPCWATCWPGAGGGGGAPPPREGSELNIEIDFDLVSTGVGLYIQRFHVLRVGTPRPNIGVAVSSVKGTSCQSYTHRSAMPKIKNKTPTSPVSCVIPAL